MSSKNRFSETKLLLRKNDGHTLRFPEVPKRLSDKGINLETAERLSALDSLRGLIMIVMALDHANHFIAKRKLEPELWYFFFPNYGDNALAFLTRFVTHLAAPGFFFIMGAGMALFTSSRQSKQWSRFKITSHFIIRGTLLILFQFLLENPAWNIGTGNSNLSYFGVLYALGGAMLLGSLFIFLPTKLLILLSALLVLFTEALLPHLPSGFATYPTSQLLFTTPGFGDIFITQTLVLYPILPWLGVMGLGFAYGRYLQQNATKAYNLALPISFIALLLFAALRTANGYGNIRPNLTEDWIGFFNLVKYPPSLTFNLLMIGLNLLFLRIFVWLETHSSKNVIGRVLTGFGREPLFFYIAHLYLYGFLGMWLNQDGAISIPQMMPYWALGLFILWPLCAGYNAFKHRQADRSHWRFF